MVQVTEFRPERLEGIPLVTIQEEDGVYTVLVNGKQLPFEARSHYEA